MSSGLQRALLGSRTKRLPDMCVGFPLTSFHSFPFVSLPAPAWVTVVGRDESGGQEGEQWPPNAGLRTLAAKLSLLPQ